MPALTACLDDEQVLGLVEGRLAAPALAAADEHLDGCATCRELVAQLARGGSPAHVLERGHVVGRYVVGELLGSGAMGRVYSAWEPELDRRVAIKVLREEAGDRLLREAQAMARLDHPNVVGVHEVGRTAEGVFVAMDLVDGESLREWAARRPPWPEALRVLADVARGLAAVHAAGVIHRDIKPDNVIVGADGRARLGDFGLARAAGGRTPRPSPDAPLAEGSPATAIAGTPAYMAPELLRGGAATAASDQFSFGVTAYETLAGKRPFGGATWAELARAIERDPPPPLRGVPGWLDATIRRCLAVDPARRFAALADVAARLDGGMSRRRPTAWIAAAATAAVLASGATYLAVRDEPRAPVARCEVGADQVAALWTPAARARFAEPAAGAIERWTARWAAERDATCAASTTLPAPTLAARERCLEHQRGELAALLAASASAPAPSGDRVVDALAALSPDECRAATPSTADPVPAEPARALAVREVERGLPAVRAAVALGDAAPVDATSAALVERARASGHAPTLAEALLARAETLRALARLPDATLAAREAAAAAERGHADDTAARAWIARVAIAGDRRELAVADDLAAIADAAIDRAGSPRRLAAVLLRLRGLVAYNRGDLAGARALLADARARFAELSGERSLDVAGIESALGSTARAAGDLAVAERHHRAALAIDRELRAPSHPDLARDLHNLAGVLRLAGELDRALSTYHEALAIEVATRGADSVQAATTRNSIALVKMAREDWAGARVDLEHALAAFTAAGHGDRAFAEHNLGLVAAAQGDHARALAHYTRAAAIYDATIGADAQSPIRLALDRARSLAARDPATARAEARRALAAARTAGIDWIAEDAQAFLDRAAPAPPLVSIEPAPASRRPVPQPQPATEPPVQPRRDVGTYGSSQNW